jgi:VanZ like family
LAWCEVMSLVEACWAGAMAVIGDLPLFWPAALLAVVFSAALAGPVGRGLRTSGWSVFALLGSVGVILAATMTPSIAAFLHIDRPHECILHQFDLPPLAQLLYPNETSLNVAMFVPLGLACALVGRWPRVAVLSALAAALPFAIEITQYLAPGLGRVCSTADVADNLTGLGIGLLIGIVLVRPIGVRASIDAVARGPR